MLWGTESAFIFDSLKALGREEEYPRIYGRGWAVATSAQVAGTLLGAPLASATTCRRRSSPAARSPPWRS